LTGKKVIIINIANVSTFNWCNLSPQKITDDTDARKYYAMSPIIENKTE